MASRANQRREVDRARVARAAAEDLERLLAVLDDEDEDVKLLWDDQLVVVPRRAVELLVETLEALGDGQDPSVLPAAKELSTGEVAKLLGVSPQYVVRLLDDGKIPSRRVGTHRRVRVSDALAYLRADDRRRRSLYRQQLTS